jgi:hypothetical protein
MPAYSMPQVVMKKVQGRARYFVVVVFPTERLDIQTIIPAIKIIRIM